MFADIRARVDAECYYDNNEADVAKLLEAIDVMHEALEMSDRIDDPWIAKALARVASLEASDDK